MLDKRAQGRPARGTATVGPEKIIEGMQEALRNLQSSNVTRKDIARFAGVTPALVTYYFPERNTLIEAATNPIVEDLATRIRKCLAQDDDPGDVLLSLISELLTCYSRDIIIIDLYVSHHRLSISYPKQDELKKLSTQIIAFFDRWLSSCVDCPYDGEFMTSALFGICRSFSCNYHFPNSTCLPDKYIQYKGRNTSKLICDIIVGALPEAMVDNTRPLAVLNQATT